jgi:hypothetical protein
MLFAGREASESDAGDSEKRRICTWFELLTQH